MERYIERYAHPEEKRHIHTHSPKETQKHRGATTHTEEHMQSEVPIPMEIPLKQEARGHRDMLQ